MNRPMKIAFSGPSGLGKTTLANQIAGKLGIPHPSTSAGDIFTKGDKKYLEDNFGYEGRGHKNVINMSSQCPDFGIEFQRLILERRAEQIRSIDPVVLDRCPIDNMVYLLTQTAHNMPESDVTIFLNQAQEIYMGLTHVIIIRYSADIPGVEDNKSRVPNRYFQKYISDVFGGVYTRYFSHIVGPRVMEIDFWDLNQRLNTVLEFVNTRQTELGYESN